MQPASPHARVRTVRMALHAAAATAVLVPAGEAGARGGGWRLTSLGPDDLIGGCRHARCT
ncbi:hypothetical protein ACFUC1_08385 [Pedococcus sp. NPDC057267]|uniref:hypothetical protein n=1 Tax=Pedococcus sp. NPDC057267 TaxID=3346077 RepID=UPI00362CC75F